MLLHLWALLLSIAEKRKSRQIIKAIVINVLDIPDVATACSVVDSAQVKAQTASESECALYLKDDVIAVRRESSPYCLAVLIQKFMFNYLLSDGTINTLSNAKVFYSV